MDQDSDPCHDNVQSPKIQSLDASRSSPRVFTRDTTRDLLADCIITLACTTVRSSRHPSLRPTPQTSARMKVVRQRDTAPELAVRVILHQLGAGYRVCARNLPGRPDIANVVRGWCIFVHGCFWHGHVGCPLFTVPHTNSDFWRRKVEDNRARDLRKEAALRELGFRVETVWQCETRDEVALKRRLAEFVLRPSKAELLTGGRPAQGSRRRLSRSDRERGSRRGNASLTRRVSRGRLHGERA